MDASEIEIRPYRLNQFNLVMTLTQKTWSIQWLAKEKTEQNNNIWNVDFFFYFDEKKTLISAFYDTPKFVQELIQN